MRRCSQARSATLARLPYLSESEFAVFCPEHAGTLAALLERKHVAAIESAVFGRRFVATTAGLQAYAETLKLSATKLARALDFDAVRLSAARWALPLVCEIYQIACASDVRHLAQLRVFCAQRFRNAPVWLHAELCLPSHGRYLLYVDHGADAIWSWRRAYQHLHRLQQRLSARVTAEMLPAVLVVTTRRQRALGHLLLARMCAPALLAATTAARGLARTQGLASVAQCGQFMALTENSNDGCPARVYAADPFVFVAPATEATPAVLAKPLRAATAPATREISATEQQTLAAFEQLSAQTLRIFELVCRNPVVPATLLAVLSGLDRPALQSALDALTSQGLIQTHTLRARFLRQPQALYLATAAGAQVFQKRTLQSEGWLRRQRFFCADHCLRAEHTFLAARFFCGLAKACAERSAALRCLDSPPGAPNQGRLPFYALAAHESEFVACDAYRQNGERCLFRPDAFGALRCGLAITRFWLEIDGTPDAPRGASVTNWAAKLKRYFAYVETRRWALRYETQPRWLIVTTNPGACAQLRRINRGIARERGCAPLDLSYCGADALARHGPLGQIWFDCAADDAHAATRVYAFDGAKPIAVRSVSVTVGK